MNRRRFLASSAALAALATLPPAAVSAAPLEPAAVTKGARWWGFGYHQEGDEIVQGPFATRAEAIAAGREHYADFGDADGPATFDTGAWYRRPVHHGDYAEEIVNELHEADTPIARLLQSAIEGRNEDNDFEGEVAEAIAEVDWGGAADAALPVLQRAVERSGLFYPGDIVADELAPDCALLAALADDKTFERELHAAVAPFVEAAGVLESSRMLEPENEQSHTA